MAPGKAENEEEEKPILQPEKRKVIILAGPTAVGKSDVAERFANGVLISADSVQVYRGVEIGANKPAWDSTERRRTVLIDLVEDEYTTGDWYDDALFTIQQLMDRHDEADSNATTVTTATKERRVLILKSIREALDEIPVALSRPSLPIIVGGTMMYLQWLIHGRPDAMRPSTTALARAQQDIEKQENDWDQAKQFVASQGKSYVAPVEHLFPNDWYRLRRILEIAYTEQEGSGTNKNNSSEVFSGQRTGRLVDELDLDVRCFFLCPDNRMEHTKIVDGRCESMIERGLIDETADLIVSGRLPKMAAKAIGYRQTLEYLNRENPNENNDDDDAFQEYLEEFCGATRRYAKRQMQWFRREKEFAFVPVPISISDKETRIQIVFEEVRRLVGLSRDEFDAELAKETSTSSQTRLANEEQGKKMKFYIYKTSKFQRGTKERQDLLQKSYEATQRVQSKRSKVSHPSG